MPWSRAVALAASGSFTTTLVDVELRARRDGRTWICGTWICGTWICGTWVAAGLDRGRLDSRAPGGALAAWLTGSTGRVHAIVVPSRGTRSTAPRLSRAPGPVLAGRLRSRRCRLDGGVDPRSSASERSSRAWRRPPCRPTRSGPSAGVRRTRKTGGGGGGAPLASARRRIAHRNACTALATSTVPFS